MSIEQVNQVIGRALLDESFREQLFSNADHALDGFDLTGQEIEALKDISPEQFQVLEETFQAQLGGGDATQAMKFMKLDGVAQSIVDIGPDAATTSNMKLIPTEDGGSGIPPLEGKTGTKATNAWPSKVVPNSSTAASGISMSTIIAIGAGVVVVVGALAAGFFYFGNVNQPQVPLVEQEAIIQPTPELNEVVEVSVPEVATMDSSEDLICLTGTDLHVCSAPGGQVVDRIGEISDEPLMLPLTPEQAAAVISSYGGSPPGVQGFSVMMLSGPETYSIQLPDSTENQNAVLLADELGSPYFGSAAFFSEDTITFDIEPELKSSGNTGPSIAGTWEDLSGPGTMTCSGVSINIPPETVGQVVISDSGQGFVANGMAETSTLEISPISDAGFSAVVTTMVEGTPVVGELIISLISPDIIEGEYTAEYESCTFQRSITMNRLSSAEPVLEEEQAPLKPAEFHVDTYFGEGETFIPNYQACIVFPDVCKAGLNAMASINSLMTSWDAYDNDIFLPGQTFLTVEQSCTSTGQNGEGETACIPDNDQGAAFIPPYPADAGWGSKGIGNPTLVSLLDVDAESVINGIYDLWMVVGVPDPDAWDGFIDLNPELVQVYEVNTGNGQQEVWKEVKVTYSTLDITTDQNRLFVVYLFEDQASAESAASSFP